MKKYISFALCSVVHRRQKDKNKDRHRSPERPEFQVPGRQRIGLITNPTGVDNQMKSTIDILHEAPNVNLVAPSVRSTGFVATYTATTTDIKDATIGLPVYSPIRQNPRHARDAERH